MVITGPSRLIWLLAFCVFMAAACSGEKPPQGAGARPPEGSVTMAVLEVGPVIGDPSTGPYRQAIRGNLGIGEYLFMNVDGDPMTPMLATSWQVTPDGALLTMTIREGVKFNTPPLTPEFDYGELTAEDVAWTLNRHNLTTNPESTAPDSQQLAATFGGAKTTGKYTLEIPLVEPLHYGLPLSEMQILRAGPAIESKKAFELLGPERVKEIAIGTGPFVQKEWVPGERGVVEAVPEHWLKTSGIQTFTVIQVPDINDRIAMLEAGDVDAAEIDLRMLADVQSRGLKFLETMQPSDTETVSVIWPGNLWEEVHALTGASLEPWNSVVYDEDHPWIGNPWGDRVPYVDADNPPGMSDMEQARLVRWALSMAIDRDAVVRELQSGVGTPIYTEYMGELYPGWDSKRSVTASQIDAILARHDCADCPTSGVNGPLGETAWPWEIKLNRERAEELLDLAGYPKGLDGVRFEIKLNKYACETGDICLAQTDAVAMGWEAVGVKTILLTESYPFLVNPRMVTREQVWPVVKNCIVESANQPLDWPLPPHDSSLTRPGWGCGFESPFLARMSLKVSREKDRGKREEWHLDVVDWMYYWQLYSGISQQPKGVAVNPDRIKSWSARSSTVPRWHRPEFIQLVGR